MKRLFGQLVAAPARWIANSFRTHPFHWLIWLVPVVATNLPLIAYLHRYLSQMSFAQAVAVTSRVIITAPHHHYYALIVLPIAAALLAVAHRSIEVAREASTPVSGPSWFDGTGAWRHTKRRSATVLCGTIVGLVLGGIQSYHSPVEPCHLSPPWERTVAAAHELVLTQMYEAPPAVREAFSEWIVRRSQERARQCVERRKAAFTDLVKRMTADEVERRLSDHRSLIAVHEDEAGKDDGRGGQIEPERVLCDCVDLLLAVRDPDNSAMLGDYKFWHAWPRNEPPTHCHAYWAMKYLGGVQLAAAFFLLWMGIVLTAEYVGFRRNYVINLRQGAEALRSGVVQLSAAIALVSLFSALRYFNQLEIELVTGRQRADLTPSHVIPMVYVGATLAALILTFPQDRGAKLITSGAPLVLTIAAFAAGYLDFYELRFLMGINDPGQLGLLAVIYVFTAVVLLRNLGIEMRNDPPKEAPESKR